MTDFRCPDWNDSIKVSSSKTKSQKYQRKKIIEKNINQNRSCLCFFFFLKKKQLKLQEFRSRQERRIYPVMIRAKLFDTYERKREREREVRGWDFKLGRGRVRSEVNSSLPHPCDLMIIHQKTSITSSITFKKLFLFLLLFFLWKQKEKKTYTLSRSLKCSSNSCKHTSKDDS